MKSDLQHHLNRPYILHTCPLQAEGCGSGGVGESGEGLSVSSGLLVILDISLVDSDFISSSICIIKQYDINNSTPQIICWGANYYRTPVTYIDIFSQLFQSSFHFLLQLLFLLAHLLQLLVPGLTQPLPAINLKLLIQYSNYNRITSSTAKSVW